MYPSVSRVSRHDTSSNLIWTNENEGSMMKEQKMKMGIKKEEKDNNAKNRIRVQFTLWGIWTSLV